MKSLCAAIMDETFDGMLPNTCPPDMSCLKEMEAACNFGDDSGYGSYGKNKNIRTMHCRYSLFVCSKKSDRGLSAVNFSDVIQNYLSQILWQ